MTIEVAECGRCGSLTNTVAMRQVKRIRYESQYGGATSLYPYDDGPMMVCPVCFDVLRSQAATS